MQICVSRHLGSSVCVCMCVCVCTVNGKCLGSSKKEEKRFNLSFCAAHFCSSRPCRGIVSFLIVTEDFASSVLIIDDDVAVTWLKIMSKLLSRKSQELFAWRG